MKIRLLSGPARGLVVQYADHTALELIRRKLAERVDEPVVAAPAVEALVVEAAVAAPPDDVERAVPFVARKRRPRRRGDW